MLKAELRMLQNYYDESSIVLTGYDKEWTSDLTYFLLKYNNKKNPPSTDNQTFDIGPVKGDGWEEINARRKLRDDRIKARRDKKWGREAKEKSANAVSKKGATPEWARKLFREIAKLTHPDKAPEDSKEKFSKIFKCASSAIDKEDYEELLSLAIDLDLPLDMLDQELCPLLEKRVIDMRAKIKVLEQKAAWVWGESFGISDVRSGLLQQMLAQSGISRSLEELKSEIKEREGKSTRG
tara:strand:+ start:206 stop:919 length:714 start_codon:yes stop_codon:yes gene_type:complete